MSAEKLTDKEILYMSETRAPEYDYSVSFTRVLATAFIVICHVASELGVTPIAQFFNVGVPIFFLISGYIYGDKEIKSPGEWLFKRYLRLEIPALLWLALVFISVALGKSKQPPLHACIFLLLNLQGLHFIFPEMEHLFRGPWFFTVIMCCYILLLCWNRISKKHPEAERLFDKGGLIPLLVFITLAMLKISVSGALAFFVGVFLKKRGLLEKIRKVDVLIYAAYFVCAVCLRLVVKRVADGTVLYDLIVVPLTHIVIGTTVFLSVKWLFIMCLPQMNIITSCRFTQHLDKISVFVYVSHTMLFDGMLLSLFQWQIPFAFQLCILFILVIALGTVLWFLGEWLTRKVEAGIRFLFI